MKKIKIMLIFGICLLSVGTTIIAASHSITFTGSGAKLVYDNRPYLTNLRIIGQYAYENLENKIKYVNDEISKKSATLNLILKADEEVYTSIHAEMTVFSNGTNVLYDRKYYK